MTDEGLGSQPQVDWRRLHAWGLPAGSIRGLLAVMIFATTWGLLYFKPDQEVPGYLSDLMFIIMGHYFASRRRSEQGNEPGPPPLWLPNGTIRLVIILGCVAVAGVLFRRGQLTALERNRGVITLLMVASFLIGVVLNAVTGWWKERGHLRHRVFEDVRAMVSMGAAVLMIGLIWNRLFPVIPPEQLDAIFVRRLHVDGFGPEQVFAAVVGFYFGSRS